MSGHGQPGLAEALHHLRPEMRGHLRQSACGDVSEWLVITALVQLPGPGELRLAPVGEKLARVGADDACQRGFQLLDGEERAVQVEGDQVEAHRPSTFSLTTESACRP